MVVIRLSRAGAKKRPFYHLVVTDSRNRRDGGNYITRVGYYNPVARGQEVPLHIEMDKVNHWEKLGAQISDRVKSLIKQFNKTQTAA
jgi:small subunit ribosomal protein S16